MADFLTLANLVDEIQRAVKASGKEDLIKMYINMVYLNEIMVCDDLYPLFWMRRIDDSLNAKAPATISGVTIADDTVTATAHGYVANDIVSVYNVVGTTELNNRTFIVNAVADANTLSFKDLEGTAIDFALFTAWTSGGTIHHRGITLGTAFGMQRIIEAAFHGYDPMTSVTPKQTETDNLWRDNTRRPVKYIHRKSFTAAGVETNRIYWFPCSDQAYDLRYWAEKRANKLTADANVPLLPPQFHHSIVAGTIARLIEHGGLQVENAVVWPQLYQAQLSALRTFNRKFYEQEQIDLTTQKPYLL